MLLGCIKPRRVLLLLLLLLLLNIRPAAPVSAQPPPPPALRPLRPYVLADCRAPYRSLLVALTCRIEGWEVSSVLCSAVREAVFRACRRVSWRGGSRVVPFESATVRVPLIVDGEVVGTFDANLLDTPQISARKFCAWASEILFEHGVSPYDQGVVHCESIRRADFEERIARASSRPTGKGAVATTNNAITNASETAESIPMVLHQTWKTREIPESFRQWADSWNNSGVSRRMWSDEDNRALVRDVFPELLNFYDELWHNILRVDLIRYVILFEHGGIYADLDVELLRPISQLLASASSASSSVSVILGLEDDASGTIDISVLASVKGHPLWLRALRRAVLAVADENIHDVLQITGNRMFTKLVERMVWEDKQQDEKGEGVVRRSHGIVVLEQSLLFPDKWGTLGYRSIKVVRKLSMRAFDAGKEECTCRCGARTPVDWSMVSAELELLKQEEGVVVARDSRGLESLEAMAMLSALGEGQCCSCSKLFPQAITIHHETGTWVDSYWDRPFWWPFW